MRCQQIRSQFTAYADGDLRPPQRRRIQEHVTSCRACQEEFEGLNYFLNASRDALECPGPLYSFQVLRARMDSIAPLQEVVAFLPKLRVQGPVPQFAVAALLLAITLAAPLLQRTGRQTYAAAKTPFNEQLARIDETYEDYFDEAPTRKLEGVGWLLVVGF